MHKVALSPSVVERVVRRCGKEHIFDDLDPAKTALLVVDMQNAFIEPGVAHNVTCPTALEIIPNINRLARTLRGLGGTVVWIKGTFAEETLKSWSTYYRMVGPQGTSRRAASLAPDSKGHAIHDGLDVLAEDLTVEKRRYSAFTPGSSDIAERLRRRGIETVLITGAATNVCCDSTARDAMMYNFNTVMVSDGNAAVNDEDHNAALNMFYLMFGDVMSTEMLVSCLTRNAKGARAAAE